MNNSSQSLDQKEQVEQVGISWPLITFIILTVIAIAIAWRYTGNIPVEVQEIPTLTLSPVTKDVAIVEIEVPDVIIEEVPVEIIEEKVAVENPLPSLNESDDWLKIKLAEITLRKNLLSLVIDEDMIRRFVVFTDNFSQGDIAYDHSPFVLPKAKFMPYLKNKGKPNTWQWNERATKRFTLYVDLLRSMDSDSLVQWYMEIKPLIDEAYNELGYEDDFTNTLQGAITRVLDMEFPRSSMNLIRPSVMYKFADPQIEGLPQVDKLLLRLGKDNLLIVKSVLLELHEKLAQQENGVIKDLTKDVTKE